MIKQLAGVCEKEMINGEPIYRLNDVLSVDDKFLRAYHCGTLHVSDTRYELPTWILKVCDLHVGYERNQYSPSFLTPNRSLSMSNSMLWLKVSKINIFKIFIIEMCMTLSLTVRMGQGQM